MFTCVCVFLMRHSLYQYTVDIIFSDMGRYLICLWAVVALQLIGSLHAATNWVLVRQVILVIIPRSNIKSEGAFMHPDPVLCKLCI